MNLGLVIGRDAINIYGKCSEPNNIAEYFDKNYYIFLSTAFNVFFLLLLLKSPLLPLILLKYLLRPVDNRRDKETLGGAEET